MGACSSETQSVQYIACALAATIVTKPAPITPSHSFYTLARIIVVMFDMRPT
jgi:hypothetical protein